MNETDHFRLRGDLFDPIDIGQELPLLINPDPVVARNFLRDGADNPVRAHHLIGIHMIPGVQGQEAGMDIFEDIHTSGGAARQTG